jgi:hypothetical protein
MRRRGAYRGPKGLPKMRQAGARTIAQDETSWVVFGMPREAIVLGATKQVLALPQIANGILTARRPGGRAAQGGAGAYRGGRGGTRSRYRRAAHLNGGT